MHNIKYLFDGAMGTYFSATNHSVGMSPEFANINNSDCVKQIHKEYLDAGCNAIKTNTFSINRMIIGDEELASKLIKAAWEIAGAAVKDYEATVFADIGPIAISTKDGDLFSEYKWVADQFIDLGATHFLFETHANLDELKEIAKYIKSKLPESFIITSFAVLPDGFSRDGIILSDLFEEVKNCSDIDVFGLNCVCGARHMLEHVKDLSGQDKPLAIMPNAGYPIVINNRTYYDGDPDYFAEQMANIAACGVMALGGCCGTTPEHIAKTKAAISGIKPEDMVQKRRLEDKVLGEQLESKFWNKLTRGEKVIAVELDSPANTQLDKFMSGAWELKGAGTDIITIADCPIARARMDSSLLACKIRRELNLDALPHMTCRDRNLNATKALLLGIYAEGIRNVLLITGDPIPTAERDEVKSVYQFNSRKLAGFVKSLGKKTLPDEFHIFGALNVNALNFDVQLALAKEKEAKGMIGFLTQPILTEEAFENLKRARTELSGYILGGIMPIVSERNARFMDSEIHGINVDPKLIEMYAGKDRSQAESLAVDISTEIMTRIADYVDGFYIMTPFGRTSLVSGIIKRYQEK